MSKMNPEIKAKWTAALRSGKYKQGNRYLKNGNTYCCLGVLCEVIGEEPQKMKYLPESVWTAAGLSGSYGALPVPVKIPDGRTADCLADANDRGLSFNEISDIIDEQL